MNEKSTPPPFRPSLGRDFLWIASSAIVYFALARLGLSLLFQPEGIAAIWPSGGFFLSAILLTRRGLRPPLVAVLCVTDFIAELLTGTTILVSAVYALVLAGDAVLSAWLLIRFVGEPIEFRKTREVIGFLALAVILSNGLMSSLAAASTLIPGTSFWNSWMRWATSDGIGNLLVTPFILSWASWAKAGWGAWNPKRALEGAALFILLPLLDVFTFSALSASNLFSLFLPYVTFPFLLWAALRFGTSGVTLALMILAAVTISFTAAGPAAGLAGPALDHVLDVQLYLAVMAVPSLFLATVVTERTQMEETLREREARMNKAEEIARVGSWEFDLATDRLAWSDETYRIFGLPPQCFVPMYQDFLDAVHPDDRSAVDAAYSGSLREGRDTYEIEHRIVRKATGEIRYVREKCEHVRDASDRIIRSIGMVHDITGRKQAEEGLRESEARFRALFEDAPIALWEEDFSKVKARFDELRRSGATDLRAWLDRNPGEVANLAAQVRIVQINKTSVRVFGAESKEQITRELPRYFTAESLEVFKEEVLALAEGRTSFSSEALRLTVGGRPAVFELTLSVQPGHEKSLSRVLVSFMDITERRRMQEALTERNRYIETILENSPIGFAVYTIDDGQGVFITSKFEEIYGVARGSLHSVADYFEKVYLDRAFRRQIRTRMTADMATGQAARMRWEDIPITTAAGEKKFVTIINIPLSDQNLMVSTVQDVTARHRTEEALRESEERFRSLIEQAGDGFELLDAEGRYADVNSATCRQLGYSKEELLRLSIFEIDPLVSREKYAGQFQSLMNNNPPITFETVHRRKNGASFPVEITTSLIRFEDGLRAVTLVRDISDRKRAEEEREKLQEQLLQAQKMESIGRLAGGVAHDFNNMLGVILGHSEVALERMEPAEPLRTHLEEIQKAAQRSADLTRQLLAFARKQTVAPKVLDLNDAVTGMLKMLRRLIGEDLDLAWMPGADLKPVRIDPAQIDQMLVNLCVNARDAITGEGKVTIETANVTFDDTYCADHPGFLSHRYVMLAVSDNGIGMDKEILDHLFEPFFTTKRQGTGMGLATVYGIVKQNEGFINVYSEPGSGTTFKIYLPSCPAETIAASVEGPARAAKKGTETILLVEDEEMLLELGKNLLEELGYTVLSTMTPGEAIRLAQANYGEIDLLITDVVLQGMNGRELSERIRAIKPDLKCLFMSGYTANVIAHRGVLDHGVQFIQKPFSIKDFAAKVREALEQA
ncbi:MAG: PAS domain S-box protein [Syntrophales bacterium]